jgi:hypothetical protein
LVTTMKQVKFAVLGSSLLATVAVFLEWVHVSGELPAILGALPRTGMENGGPIFLVLLAMPLAGAGIGAAKRFGRGLAGLSLFGALCASFLGLVKYADIEAAGREVGKLGAKLEVTAGVGYWLFLVGAVVALLASVVGLIKPEKVEAPKLASGVTPGSSAAAA